MKKSSAKGFTLVEIMIVVAIIGIIIAIAVPAFLRARENARGQACQENLTKIDGAKEQYALEFRYSNGAAITGGFATLINPTGGGTGTGYLKGTPECPTNGSYTIGNIGTNPTCSVGTNTGGFIEHVIPGNA